MLHPGDNSIVIRAYAHSPNGQSLFAGFASVQAPTAQPGINDVYPLTGEWQYRIVFDQHLGSEALAAFPHHPRETIPHPAFGLYNGMIHPLRDFAIAGAIWYQGEGNAGRYAQLPKLMEHLIGSWRRQWHTDLPFYIVQLPIFQDRNWPMMRAAQQQITRDIPNTAIAVTIDTGEVTNIRPKEKQPVGDRLALLALHRVYGLKLEDSGPFFASAQPEGAKLRISFTHAEGLHATGPAIPHFEIAGADGKFLPAEAIIEKQTIVLSNSQISRPTAARYAWSPTPLGTEVYNSANLPLAPFTTP
jgi:sialate O-acetylesterase